MSRTLTPAGLPRWTEAEVEAAGRAIGRFLCRNPIPPIDNDELTAKEMADFILSGQDQDEMRARTRLMAVYLEGQRVHRKILASELGSNLDQNQLSKEP